MLTHPTHPVYRASRFDRGALHRAGPFLARETTPATPPNPWLADRVRAATHSQRQACSGGHSGGCHASGADYRRPPTSY